MFKVEILVRCIIIKTKTTKYHHISYVPLNNELGDIKAYSKSHYVGILPNKNTVLGVTFVGIKYKCRIN